MVLIQEIRAVWSKASRGGAAAASRNSVPEAALFPAIKWMPVAWRIFHQRLVYGETNGFADPVKSESVELTTSLADIGCIKIMVSPERVIVSYEHDRRRGGLPPHQIRPGVNAAEERVVVPESWVRVRYDGRFSGDGVVVREGSGERRLISAT